MIIWYTYCICHFFIRDILLSLARIRAGYAKRAVSIRQFFRKPPAFGLVCGYPRPVCITGSGTPSLGACGFL